MRAFPCAQIFNSLRSFLRTHALVKVANAPQLVEIAFIPTPQCHNRPSESLQSNATRENSRNYYMS